MEESTGSSTRAWKWLCQGGRAHCTLWWPCSWWRGSLITQLDEWQITSASRAHLNVKNYERRTKDKPCLDGTARNTTVVAERHSKAEWKRKLKRETHLSQRFSPAMPEPHCRAIIVKMVYLRKTSIGKVCWTLTLLVKSTNTSCLSCWAWLACRR